MVAQVCYRSPDYQVIHISLLLAPLVVISSSRLGTRGGFGRGVEGGGLGSRHGLRLGHRLLVSMDVLLELLLLFSNLVLERFAAVLCPRCGRGCWLRPGLGWPCRGGWM